MAMEIQAPLLLGLCSSSLDSRRYRPNQPHVRPTIHRSFGTTNVVCPGCLAAIPSTHRPFAPTQSGNAW
jgi:hypothetical protein